MVPAQTVLVLPFLTFPTTQQPAAVDPTCAMDRLCYTVLSHCHALCTHSAPRFNLMPLLCIVRSFLNTTRFWEGRNLDGVLRFPLWTCTWHYTVYFEHTPITPIAEPGALRLRLLPGLGRWTTNLPVVPTPTLALGLCLQRPFRKILDCHDAFICVHLHTCRTSLNRRYLFWKD